MIDRTQFYIDGQWVSPEGASTIEVINPANEEPFAQISLGTDAHADQAMQAARAAFASWGQTTKEERMGYISALADVYDRRGDEMAKIISEEMGAKLEDVTLEQLGSMKTVTIGKDPIGSNRVQ